MVSHVLGIGAAILHWKLHGLHASNFIILIIFVFLSNFAVGGGYHRCFSHGGYQATWPLKLFFITFGPGAFEGSALNWASMHRRHHMVSDTNDDPHNIARGFFWAHMGWIFLKLPPSKVEANIDDLKKDPWLRFEEKWYVPLAITFGILLPWGIGYLCGDHWGGLAIGSFFRIVVFHHITWTINSLAHTLGRRPYSEKITAKDSFITALFTLGEGYHNYHHAYPWDYRNGYRWLTYDPTKWLVYLLSLVGLTKDLQRVSKEVIARHDSQCR